MMGLAWEMEETLQLGLSHGEPRKAKKLLKAVLNAIKKGLLRDGKVQIQGFGTFHVVPIPARQMFTFHKEWKWVPEYRQVHFRFSHDARKFVDQGVEDTECQ